MGLSSKILNAGLLLTVVFLPWSPFGTSIGMGLLALSWIVAVSSKSIIKQSQSLLPLAFVACFALCTLGLLWSENLGEGFAAIKIKLPILIVPLALFFVQPLKNTLKYSVKLMIVSSLLAAIVGIFWGYIIEPGDFSPFISHIRMGLLLALCLGLALLEKKWLFSAIYGMIAIASVWHTQSITGVGMIAFAIFYSLVSIALPRYRTQTIIASIATVLIAGAFTFNSLMPTAFYGVLEGQTPWGNKYTHFPEKHLEENGNKVWINLAVEEMRPAWNKISSMPFDSLDANGFPIMSTITRYLTSQGKPKNGLQIASLTSEDIANIESGHTSIRKSTHSGLSLRMDDLRFELGNYFDGGNPNDNSVTMRLESFKAGTHVLKTGGASTLIFGVGTGDLPDALNLAYTETESRLQKKFWKRTHNQYLAWWIGCGVLGLMLWLIILYSSWTAIEGSLRLAWWIVALSCLAEDTLETQAGVTFTMLSLCIFTLVPKNRN